MLGDVSGQTSDVQSLLHEARTLVAQLYDPANTGNPAKIKAIQDHLQILQKGPQAWLIANDLLTDVSTGSRFFGALTFTVKINHDWQQLSETESRELLARLIDHYILLVNGGEQTVVIRKLATSLANIFLKPNAPWTRALLNLAASFAHGSHLPEDQCPSIDLKTAILPALSERQLVTLLYFSNVLAEEIGRWNSESRRGADPSRIGDNVKDAFSLVEYILHHIIQQESSGSPVADGAAGTEAINSYQSWMSVRAGFQMRDTISALQLSPTTNYVIQSLGSASLARTAMQVLVELMDWRDSIFSPDHISSILDFIVSGFGSAHMASLMDGDFEDENMTFLELLLAYATLKQKMLLTQPLDPKHEKVLTLVHTLLKVPGYAAVDDSASPIALEWWTEVADYTQEMFLDSEDQSNMGSAKQNLARAAMDCFEKLKYPSPQELQDWSDDERSEFSAFRRDVCDFLLAVYPILGVELVQVFQQHARSSLTQQDWKTFEAAVFCLGQLSEAVDENQHADGCLNAIFYCEEFSRLCEGGDVMIPDKSRQTLVDMLGRYQSYFERTHALLPRVLTFLFTSLDVVSCAPVASKSISYLCKSCRNALMLELPVFLDQFDTFRFKPTATSLTMERVLEGIAAIVQALPADEEKAGYLERILKFFHEQAQVARDEAARGLIEPAQNRGQFALRCIASVGKGLRADHEIILEASDATNSGPYPPTFWNTGNGATTQNLIMQTMQLLMTDFPFDVAIIEAVCDILKAGYTERTGPFVFPPMITVNFVNSIPPGSTGIDMIMGTASAFLASHSAHPEHVRDEAIALIVHVYENFCWMHEKPEFYDPEVANSGIDFLTRLLPKYYDFLFTLTGTPPTSNQTETQRPPVLQAILNFTLFALQGTEPLPLRSASQFWVGVMNIPGNVESVQNALRDSISALSRILISQVAGRCARSDLEHLCEVLRKVVFKQQGLARPHLTAALAELDHNQTNQSHGHTPPAEERQRFLASLLAARGSKAPTVSLTRTFWVKCRGAGFDYIG
ncbi:armadillo-type protein [Aspergillus ambiguus]|uniref:putative importin 13 n=1 Tax=Aspergillus ambiguus TaxID=176160 RepID=UPI003CCD791B